MNLTSTAALLSDQVHVWKADLDWCERQTETLRTALSPDELKKASDFHFERDRRRYIVARGILRRLVASYLETDADRIVFHYSARGKPELAFPSNARLRFNVSHSGSVALFVFSSQRVGIDVERIRPDFEFEPIMERFFSPYEVRTIRRLSVEERRRAFFICWTRKEAYIKARGDGLNFPLDQFDVSLDDAAPTLLEVRQEPAEAQMWKLMNAHPASGYVGAVAVEGQRQQLIRREWFSHDSDVP